MKSLKSLFLSILLVIGFSIYSSANSVNDSTRDGIKRNNPLIVYKFEIREMIAKPVWHTTKLAFEEAKKFKADYILIHMNTYGGLVNIADSIRTKILNSEIPVLIFIDNQAISAGALISIACDSIYMRMGASIGAASVVDQNGTPMPDKYQSFMRATMRATAESHGKDTIIKGSDTTYVWRRDPLIAEAMVDSQLEVEGINPAGKVLTFSTEEAIKNHYCEGVANSVAEALKKANIKDYKLIEYKPAGVDVLIKFLLNPVVQGILIMLILGGIYFELQAPGIGFPIIMAASAALLYFAPLYLQGLAENWEILIFVAGLVLLGLEIFVIPGFGIAGISGILLIIFGLTMSLVDNLVFEYEGFGAMEKVLKALFRVVFSFALSFFLSLFISKKIFTSRKFKFALHATQQQEDGYISVDLHQKEMIGKKGIAFTMLRPSGKVEIDGEVYDAKAEIGYIDKGEKIKVIRDETGQLYVIKLS